MRVVLAALTCHTALGGFIVKRFSLRLVLALTLIAALNSHWLNSTRLGGLARMTCCRLTFGTRSSASNSCEPPKTRPNTDINQLLQAEQMAASWLNGTKKVSPVKAKVSSTGTSETNRFL